MSDTSIKENINLLFSNLGIKKVVFVDDYNDEVVTVESILTSPERNTIFEKYFPQFIRGDIDIENDTLRKAWEDIPFEIKKQIKDSILSETDKNVIPELKQIFSNELLLSKSPMEWIHEKDKLLTNCNSTLFLFDQELGLDERKDNGINIIKEITKDKEVMCCLFTQINEADNYLSYRDKLSEDYNISRDKFFVIPKKELSENKPMFVYLLKLTILCRYFLFFKSHVHEILCNSAKAAEEKIGKIGIEDFDHIIFKTPLKEGAWEPDMFYRMYSGIKRREYNSSISADTEINSAISKIRSVSGIMPKGTESFLIPSNAWNIQHNELYERAEYLNNNNLPIEVGDIFLNTENNEKYILLFRPCDLFLRTNGKRAKNAKRLTLVKISNFLDENKFSQYDQKFSYFGDSNREKWKLNFREILLVRDYILDLCSYNSEGRSRYTSNPESNASYRPSLISRYKIITEQINKTINHGNEILGESKEENTIMKKSIYEAVFKDDYFYATFEQNNDNFSLNFNCRRVGRLLYERAINLLAEYYSVMQRPGYPPDFG